MNATASSLTFETTLSKFEKKGNVGLIGPTNSGKTWTFKRFLCDSKIELYDTFIYVGNVNELEEIRNAYCAHLFLHGKNWQSERMLYFNRSQIDKAIAYCESNKTTNEQKLIYFDDALINKETKSNIKKDIGNFCHQSKNYNTTVYISIHIVMGGSEEKMIRSSLRYYVFLNEDIDTISRLTKLDTKGPTLKIYEMTEKKEKLLIYDVTNRLTYGNDYNVAGGVKNYVDNKNVSIDNNLLNKNDLKIKQASSNEKEEDLAATRTNSPTYESAEEEQENMGFGLFD